MNQRQFDLVKVFIDVFKVPPAKLASRWRIDLSDVRQVAVSANYEAYKDSSDDPMAMFGELFKGIL